MFRVVSAWYTLSANSLITEVHVMDYGVTANKSKRIKHNRKRDQKRKKKVDHLIAIHSVAFSHLTQHVIIIIIMMQNYRTFVLFLSFFVHRILFVRLPIFSAQDRHSNSIPFVTKWYSLRSWGQRMRDSDWDRYLNANRNIFQAFETIVTSFHFAHGKLNLMDFNFSWHVLACTQTHRSHSICDGFKFAH